MVIGRTVAEDKDFQLRLQRIGDGLNQLERVADPAVRSMAQEVVQLLLEMHGSALERMLEMIFQSGEAGIEVIDEFAQDPEVSSLLILHGLHPDDLEARIERKLAEIRSRLFKMGAEAKLVGVIGGDVRIRVTVQGHVCGSTLQRVRAMVEESMYEASPDLTSLVVEGPGEPSASGFVAMEVLAASGVPAASAPAQGMAADSQD